MGIVVLYFNTKAMPYTYIPIQAIMMLRQGQLLHFQHQHCTQRRQIETNISFQTVKNTVDTRTAAEFYGLSVNHSGMTCCPFHDDRQPSMRIYDNHHSDSRYICFGCGETGDVIDFTAKLFGLTKIEAAQKLMQDFGITADKQSIFHRIRYPQENIHRTFHILSDYTKLLEEWQTEYKPKSLDDEIHPRFMTGLNELEKLRYYQDIFITGTKEEQTQLSKELQEDIQTFEREIRNARKQKSVTGHER